MSNGWNESAAAWIADVADGGDFGRKYVLDRPVMARIAGRGFKTALDVGCGEGRLCRMLRDIGIEAVGVDPTKALLDHARRLDPAGDYRLGRAEDLDFADSSFDLVSSYLSLIDIPDSDAAIAEISRVLRPGGTCLIVNLTGFTSAGANDGWIDKSRLDLGFAMDRYLEDRGIWSEWRGIRILNWHRPLERYMSAFLENGLILRHFAEPAPYGGEPKRAERYRRVPYYVIMEWQKPES